MYKLSSKEFAFDLAKLVTNQYLILGLALYFIGAMLLVYALKFGELSMVYPFISLTFIWVFIIGVLMFQEVVSLFKLLGTLSIVLGVSLIGRA